MKSQETKKGNSLLKSILTLIVTLLLGTTAFGTVQDVITDDGNVTTNQTIGTESNTNNSSDNGVTSEDSSSNNSTVTTNDSENDTTVKEEEVTFTFRSQKLLDSHYEKHGKEMGFSSAKEYEQAASKVVTNKEALHKIEAEDGDDVYYIESTNEFVIVSTDGYLRTYFYPSDGLDYFNRQ